MLEDINKIEKVIYSRQYPFFWLLHEDGRTIVPSKRFPRKHNAEGYIQHWNFIKHKLINELPIGRYCFQAFYDTAKKTVSNYWLEKKENESTPVLIDNMKMENKTDKATMMYEKDMIELIKENERLKAEKSVLLVELKNWQDKYTDLENEFSELESEISELGDGATGGIQGGMTALAPLIPILEKFMEQSDKRLKIEELKLQKATPKVFKPLRKIATQNNEVNENRYENVLSYFVKLFNENEEQANNELDVIMDNNPSMYNQLIKDLNLEENEN